MNVLRTQQMSLPTKNIKKTSEQLTESLDWPTITTPCNLDTRNVLRILNYQNAYGKGKKKTLITICSGA